MTIRTATEADIPRIVEMCMEFLRDSSYAAIGAADHGKVEALTVAMVTGAEHGVFVADGPDGVVGVAAVHAFEHPMFALRMASELVWWLDPAARGGSTAVRLMAALEQWAKDHGVPVLHMIAPTERVAEVYRRRGYQFVESAFVRRV